MKNQNFRKRWRKTYFLERDRQKFELEVYNPATVVARISNERKTRKGGEKLNYQLYLS